MHRWTGLCVLAAMACALTPTAALGDDCSRQGRSFTQWFLSGQIDSLWTRLSPEMKKAVRGLDGFRGLAQQVSNQAGHETGILSETCEAKGTLRTYKRHSTFEHGPATIFIQWTWDPKGTIVGALVRPVQQAAPTQFLGYQTKTRLRLPFRGEWYTFWGGRTVEENYHVIARDQRFAYDFVQMRKGVSHDGDGKRNEQYYCFGQAVLAPGAGIVVTVADTLPDNEPGLRDPAHPFGNSVVIDHGHGECSVLAHLERGSLRVRPGQTVAAGDTLGLCGNSGNTTEPHVHYHLQNQATLGDADGIPAFFADYQADGAPVARGEPKKGQTVTSR